MMSSLFYAYGRRLGRMVSGPRSRRLWCLVPEDAGPGDALAVLVGFSSPVGPATCRAREAKIGDVHAMMEGQSLDEFTSQQIVLV